MKNGSIAGPPEADSPPWCRPCPCLTLSSPRFDRQLAQAPARVPQAHRRCTGTDEQHPSPHRGLQTVNAWTALACYDPTTIGLSLAPPPRCIGDRQDALYLPRLHAAQRAIALLAVQAAMAAAGYIRPKT